MGNYLVVVDPNAMKDVEAARRLLANATRLKRDGIANACRIRIYELPGCDYADPIERRLWQAVSHTKKNTDANNKPAIPVEKLLPRAFYKL